MIHNKNLILLSNLLIYWMSAKSAPQILSLNDEHTFLLLNFLLIVLWSSSASCWFGISLIPLPEDFLSKICKP